jgi:hypothetical protein
MFIVLYVEMDWSATWRQSAALTMKEGVDKQGFSISPEKLATTLAFWVSDCHISRCSI